MFILVIIMDIPTIDIITTRQSKKLRPLGRCDQEVNERTHVAPRKVREEVSKKEIRNHFEPCDVQVSLPRRAEE